MRATTGRNRHSWPALAIACWVAAGIVCGMLLPGPDPPLVFTAVLSILAGGGFFLVLLSSRHAGSPAASLFALFLCLFTGFRLGRDAAAPSCELPRLTPAQPVTLWGTVADYPLRTPTAIRLIVDVKAYIADSMVVPWRGRCQVTVRTGARGGAHKDVETRYGDVIAVAGECEDLPRARNPGEFDPERYYAAQGILMLCTVRSPASVCRLGTGGGWWLLRDVIAPLRRSIIVSMDTFVGGEEGEFLKGLMIGEKAGLRPELRQAFLVSGVAHILAVSGSNVAVIAGSIVMLLSLVRFPRRWIPFPTAIGILMYMLLTGSQPPVVRATIMALVLLAAGGWGVRGNALNGIGIAALIMFVLDAGQILDIGFQLSFGAVLSIILFYPPLNRRIAALGGGSVVSKTLRGALRLSAVSVASSVGTLPLTALAFGQISLIGVAANIVVVPLSGWSVVLGCVTAASALLAGWLAAGFAEVNSILLWLALRVTELCAGVPFASVSTLRFPQLAALPFYAGLAVVYHAGRPAEMRGWCIALLASANLASFASDDDKLGPGVLRITFIDVGQGDAILLEHAGGGAALVDTGPVPDAWTPHVQSLLQRRGIDRLDFVLLTHPHDDHTGGLASIREVARICTVYTHETFRAGGRIAWTPAVRLYVLCSGLDAADSARVRRFPNRASVVVRMVYGSTSILLMADAEREEEERLHAAYASSLASTVIKIGHHGSAAASSQHFLAAVRPRLAVVCVGRRNRFGHPSRAVLRRIADRGAEVARTDEDGAVIVETDGVVWGRRYWRSAPCLASRHRDGYHRARDAKSFVHDTLFESPAQTPPGAPSQERARGRRHISRRGSPGGAGGAQLTL